MTKADLPTLRHLVKNGQISFTSHAVDQMFERGITRQQVKEVLISNKNQIIECQSPSKTDGKRHNDERILISDPDADKDIIVIVIIEFKPLPGIRVITVEHTLDEKWDKNKSKDPWLIRK